MGRLKLIVPITFALIFSLLFWAFRDIRPAMLVLAMVPFTLIGGFCRAGLAGLHLSVSAAVGFIAVAGISVQNGVIMVEQVIEIARRGATRSRPSSTARHAAPAPHRDDRPDGGLGLLPAALSHGIGSETQRPFRRHRRRHRQRHPVHPAAAARAAILRRRQRTPRAKPKHNQRPRPITQPPPPHAHAHPHRRRRPAARRRRRPAAARRPLLHHADYVGSAEQAESPSPPKFDLLVLDIGLPGMDGLELLSRLRARHNPIGVLMLTARDALNERVRGLNLGADDYLTKPFAAVELLARVNALARRSRGQSSLRREFGPGHRRRGPPGLAARPALDLPQREWAILQFLPDNPERCSARSASSPPCAAGTRT